MSTVIGVFGVPCVGKGSVVQEVQDQMLERYRVATITTSYLVKKLMTDADVEAMKNGALFQREDELREAIFKSVEALWAFGAEVVILDGCPRFDDQVRWMRQVFYDHDIQIVQILGPTDFELVRRAGARGRDEFDTNAGKCMQRIAHQRSLFPGLEQQISKYGLHYTSVINDDVKNAAQQFISKVRWPDIDRKEKKEKDK